MEHAAGLGVRYKTPIGPVRFDVAYAVNPPYFIGCNGTIDQLIAGQPCQQVPQHVGHFQVHFALGQSF